MIELESDSSDRKKMGGPQVPEIATSGQNTPFFAMTDGGCTLPGSSLRACTLSLPRHCEVSQRPKQSLFCVPNTPWVPEIATSGQKPSLLAMTIGEKAFYLELSLRGLAEAEAISVLGSLIFVCTVFKYRRLPCQDKNRPSSQ